MSPFKLKLENQVKSLKDVLEIARQLAQKHGPYRIAVAVGEDVSGIGGLALGRQMGMVEPILVGHRRHIKESFDKLGITTAGWQIITEKDHLIATQKAAKLVMSGKAEVLMRGRLLARDFFKALLDPKLGAKKSGAFWSNVVVVNIEGLDRLLFLTDCAVVVNTDLSGRLRLIQNALDIAAFLGVREAKVALLAAVESVSPGMPISLEEAIIAKMSERGQFPKGIQVDGPLSLDLAVNRESVKKKGIKSPVAGAADVLVLNNISVGNVLFKSLITLCGANSASTIAGASFPIVLTSRSEHPENIIYSLALSILMAGPK